MTENKSSAMTDSKIIKGLECCASDEACCSECPYSYIGTASGCYDCIKAEALDLINRQQAEIEDLKKIKENSLEIISMGEKQILEIRENSIKEFADRLKNGVDSLPYKWLGISETVLHTIIDNLVKEMVGDNNAEIQS